MCIQHSFGDHPSHYPDFISTALEAPPNEPLPSCMDGILKNFTCEVCYLKNEIETSTSADIDDGDFGRSSSRVGKIYQVDKIANEPLAPPSPNTIGVDDGKVFSTDIISDADINAYLYRVQLLRARHVSAGSLLQAPFISTSTPNNTMTLSAQYSIHATNDNNESIVGNEGGETKGVEESEAITSTTASSKQNKGRKKKPLIPCIAVNKRTFRIENTESTDVFENIRTLIQLQEVDVFDGFNEWTVPLGIFYSLTHSLTHSLVLLLIHSTLKFHAKYCHYLMIEHYKYFTKQIIILVKH